MPIDQATVLHIVCDNEACPGNTLDPKDRTGWTFINAEIYGQPGAQFVYCCAMCAGTVSGKIEELAAQVPPPVPEPEQQPA